MSDPLILTLEMDGESFGRLDELRRRFYPPGRNQVPAHVTLFHQLPWDRAREIKGLLKLVTTRFAPLIVEADEPRLTDSGVAVFLRSPQLHALRGELQAEWSPWLGLQDQHGWRPHVTIQNKVGAEEARRTMREMAAVSFARRIRGIGLHLWRYKGGPWEDIQLFRFAKS